MKQAISGGHLSPPGTEDSTVLLAVTLESGLATCSGTVVAPNLVLTARHCVSFTTEGPFTCTTAGELVEESPGAGRMGAHLPAESLAVYGGLPPRKAPLAFGERVISSLSTNICQNDIAFLLLDRSLDLPVATMRLDRPAIAGAALTLVGFGRTSGTTLIDPRTHFRTRDPGRSIAEVGPDSLKQGRGAIPPRTFKVAPHSLCEGDSGGPAFSEATGAVLGVFSYGTVYECAIDSEEAFFTHVPPFSYLTNQAFEAAGASPLPELAVGEGSDAGTRAPTDGSTAEGGPPSVGDAACSDSPIGCSDAMGGPRACATGPCDATTHDAAPSADAFFDAGNWDSGDGGVVRAATRDSAGCGCATAGQPARVSPVFWLCPLLLLGGRCVASNCGRRQA